PCMSSTSLAEVVQLDPFRWSIPREGAMRVPGVLFADRALLERMFSDRTPEQVKNAAHLPGILEASIAMPDAHWGYGLPVGGVIAAARERGRDQLGTLGSGNHFLEVQEVEQVFDSRAARVLGLEPGTVTVMIHCGSRGLGHQVCTDYVREVSRKLPAWGITLPDRQLACAPLGSPEATAYLGAMCAAANFAWANRQCIAHGVRRAFESVLGRSAEALGLGLVYDVAHNIAKFETHEVAQRPTRCLVHRKGATPAFPPGHRDVPAAYRAIGQPVLVPGDMGRYSYVLVGSAGSMRHAFGSTCHGAGRQMSRTQAVRETRGRDLVQELREQGVAVRYEGRDTLRE